MLIFHGRRISLNLVLLLVVVNYVSGFRLVLMYISCIISIGLSHAHLPSFYLLSAIVHRNRFFRCTNNKSSESKVNFRQTSNRCKRFLKLPNLHMLIKQKSSPVPRNLALGTFGELSVFNKGDSPIPHLFNSPEVLSSAYDKAKLIAEKCS